MTDREDIWLYQPLPIIADVAFIILINSSHFLEWVQANKSHKNQTGFCVKHLCWCEQALIYKNFNIGAH